MRSPSSPTRTLLTLALCLGAADLSRADWLQLSPDQLINLSGRHSVPTLVDEQPAPGTRDDILQTQPKTPIGGLWQSLSIYYPMPVVVDLQVDHHIKRIAYFDGQGAAKLDVHAHVNGQWTPVCSDTLQPYMQWTVQDIDLTTRYLRFTFENPGASIHELLVDATPQGPIHRRVIQKTDRLPALMNEFIGVNGFIDDPIDRLAAFGHLREYHQWQWDEGNTDPTYEGYPHHQAAWSPSWVSGPGWGWDFDQYYHALNEAGVEVVPCIQGCAPYALGHQENVANQKPVPNGLDPALPESYREHASFLFQFAARYGSRTVPDSQLQLRPGQPRRSGLGYIRYLENWNEPDKWWESRAEFFSPAELAAMCSADRDGHRGALGNTFGIRQADPNLKLVLGGLAMPEIEYLRAMQFWADLHRDGEFPADVVNLHHYSNDAGGQQGQPTTGISPEADGLRERFARIVAWRDKNVPDREIWVSEFGYDTNPESVQRAPAIGDTPADEVQACWLVRSFLELAASGIDRAQLFMLRDVNAPNTVKFNSSGVTAEKWNQHRPKRSWFYLSAMRHVLTDTRFRGSIDSGHSEVRAYRFETDDPSRSVIAFWCPTSRNEVVSSFAWKVDAAQPAQLTSLEPDMPQGRTKELSLTNGKVEFTVSERPVFLTVTVSAD